MNVNQKGFVGLTRVVADLAARGYEVFLPAHDFSAVDLIALNTAGVAKRIQVKYRSSENGSVAVPLATVVNGKHIPIDKGHIDGWAMFVADRDAILYLPVSLADNSSSEFRVRFEERTTNRRSGSRPPAPMFSDFTDPVKLW